MYSLLLAVAVSGDLYVNCAIGMPCALEEIELTAGQKEFCSCPETYTWYYSPTSIGPAY
jgi:hypothetical protein